MSVAWHGGSIVAGFKGEYALVRHESGGGESTHLSLLPVECARPRIVLTPPEERVGRAAAPAGAAKLPEALLLGSDGTGTFTTLGGGDGGGGGGGGGVSSTHDAPGVCRGALQWQQQPTELTHLPPYVASLVGGDAISVHCLGSSVDGERLPLPVQTVPLRATKESDLGKPRALCSDGGCVYVGCTR